MSAVVLADATVRFRGTTALADVSTAFAPDTITGLLGRNGAGKTTLMQLVAGHRLPISGTVRVFGEEPFENDGVLPRICFVKESQRYPDHFRVVDAVTAASRLFPSWDGELAASLLADFELPLRRQIRKLSRGMTSAVGIVIGLASRAALTLFDEPYLGLDAVARQLFYDRLLADYAEHPRSVVLSTHLIDEIGDLLEHVVLLDHGRVVVDEAAERLRSSALTVSGPTTAVDAAVRNYEVLHRESLAGRTRVMVRTVPGVDVMMSPGVTLEPVNLQQLVVAMSRREPALADHLEEYAR
jgi:ABC-2 type transport system ATP-binding protein